MSARELVIQASYLAASVLFILGLGASPTPTGRGAACSRRRWGWLLAIVGTLLHHEIVRYDWIAAGLVLGTVIGYPARACWCR